MTVRLDTIEAVGTLVVEECCNCGTLFAMSTAFQKRALASRGPNGVVFYCPKGHKQRYVGETDEQKAIRQRDQARQDAQFWSDQYSAASRDAEHQRRSKAAIRGHLTRMRNKIANGVCPVSGCRRHFDNVQNHIRGEHPDWLADHDIELDQIGAPE